MKYIENLRYYRKKAGLTQQQVAEQLNIPQTQIVRYEQGKNELPIRYLIALCKLYNTTPNDMLGLDDNEVSDMKAGYNLREIRTRLGYSQEDMADMLHTTQPQYSKYERGIQDMTAQRIIEICKILNVSADELLGLSPVRDLQHSE